MTPLDIRSLARSHAIAGCLAWLACAGCADNGTDSELAIGGVVVIDGASELCAGAPTLIELEVHRLESELGQPFDEPVDFVTEDVAQACADAELPVDIGRGAAGCAIAPNRIATDLGYLSHELVHAHRLQRGIEGTPFFEEGLAVVLGDRRPAGVVEIDRPADATAADVVRAATVSYGEYTARDLDLGKHFVAWLAADDPDRFRELVGAGYDASSVESTLMGVYGETLASLGQRWEEQSEEAYVFQDLCAEAGLLDADGVQANGAVSCDDRDTVTLKGVVLQDRGVCFRLDGSTEIQVTLAADSGELLLRPLDCPGTNRIIVVAGEDRTLELPGCKWSAVFSTNMGASEFSYSIAPTGSP